LSLGASIGGVWAGQRLRRNISGRRIRDLLEPLVKSR
jgi:hypothetical protein